MRLVQTCVLVQANHRHLLLQPNSTYTCQEHFERLSQETYTKDYCRVLYHIREYLDIY